MILSVTIMKVSHSDVRLFVIIMKVSYLDVRLSDRFCLE